MNRNLKKYQRRVVKKIIKRDSIVLNVGMGLGKTLSTLQAMEKLLNDGEFKRVLVVGPLPVIEHTWPAEIEKWGFDFSYTTIRHKSPAKRELQLLGDEQVFLINFEMLKWLSLSKNCKPFMDSIDVLVVDELSKAKSTGTYAFRLLKKYRSGFKKRIGLTGTLMSESYTDLYGQFTIIDDVWRTKGEFLSYFRNVSRDLRYPIYVPLPGAKKQIRKDIKPHLFTLRTEDYTEVPDYTVTDYWFDLSPAARKKYDEIKRNLYVEFGEGEYSSEGASTEGADIAVDDVSAMRLKLRQIISGFIYDERKQALVFDDKKMRFAKSVLDEIDENKLLLYQLTEECDKIIDTFGAELLSEPGAMARWCNGNTAAAVGHPLSMGHGLNLQDGGRIIVFYSLPRSMDQYAQSIARLYRTGQKGTVNVIRFLARDTVDVDIVDALQCKLKASDHFKLRTLGK